MSDEIRWLKLYLRLVALEANGPQLCYRFEFSNEPNFLLVCDIYFTDQDTNSIHGISRKDQGKIYDGWIDRAVGLIRRAIELAELPSTFRWDVPVCFELYETSGMGSAKLLTAKARFRWYNQNATLREWKKVSGSLPQKQPNQSKAKPAIVLKTDLLKRSRIRSSRLKQR